MRIRPTLIGALTSLGLLAGAGAASAAGPSGPPPPPTAPGGQTVTTVASGLGTPTSFAFGAGTMFEGDGGSSENGPPNGGIFTIAGGQATKIISTPQFVAGVAWHAGALYASGGTLTKSGAKWQLLRYSGWNGSAFAHTSVLWTAPKGVDGLNGIAFGPDNRLYVGMDVGLTTDGDHAPATPKTPYRYDVLSFTAQGKGLRVFATGIRQPWQIAFAPGSAAPFISALSADKVKPQADDYVLRVHQGDNYGFPQCDGVPSLCQGYTAPWASFTPHTSIMGLAVIGKRLYMTSFGGIGGKGPGGEVLSMPLSGKGKPTPVLTGFVAPTVGLGSNGQTLYVGELTGQVFSVNP
jgi:glucose/arabinose dehydrogenase